MSQSLANIIVHLVFSTKGRRQLLRDEERGQLHAYIAGILANHDSPLIEINSVRDHIHILFVQSKNHAPAKIVAEIKTSSMWMKKTESCHSDFAWQTGYGEFSVSPMHASRCAPTFGSRQSITSRKIFKPNIGGFAKRTRNRWTNVMRGIEARMGRSCRAQNYMRMG